MSVAQRRLSAMLPPPPPDALASALAYLARGWSVIPVAPRDKRPLVPWGGFQRRYADEAEIRQWFRRWPAANVAIVTGVVSQLAVLDVDARHGGDASLAEWERAHAPLPHTIEARTGSGGRHFYFAHPGGLLHNQVGLAPGIDLRGDGGFVVAPPSVHPSGRRYEWLHPPGEAPLAPMPPWLLQHVRRPGTRPGHPLSHWRQLLRAGVQEGERNNSIASLAGHLLWHGVDPAVALELLLCWNATRCRPPLSPDEVARTVESIVRLHVHGRADAGEPTGDAGAR
jgi:hypothetical protein